MAIEVPAAELTAVASVVRTKGRSLSENAEASARAADRETDGLLHQGASGMVSSVAQKLAHALDLGGLAQSGLADGLVDVVTRFGDLDRAAGTPDLGPTTARGPR